MYTFLDGLDDQLDRIRGDVLQMRPFPTIEQAYAHIRREAIRQTVMITGGTYDTPGAVLDSKGFKAGKVASSSIGFLSLGSGKLGASSKPQKLPNGTKCTHYGNMKHTLETCFKLHGYPNWWNELQTRKHRDTTGTDREMGKAALATIESSLSLTSLVESSHGMLSLSDSGNSSVALFSSHQEADSSTWILNSGAIDHMTFDANDFSHTSPP